MPFAIFCMGIMLLGATRRVGGLKALSGKREVPSGARSLGTILPPAVTRNPGGLPCSLRSFSALPRLIDGVGDGFLSVPTGAVGAVDAGGGARGSATEEVGRRLLPDDLLVRFADADADGRRTCSTRVQRLGQGLTP